jgi:hypothetical protein
MGEPMWRLATSINYVSENIFLLGREQEVEIIVSDWGSSVPIAKVLKLTEMSSTITQFLPIPEDKARELQKDSPFAEVFALNAAARASSGLFIGRIDQDTLVEKNFISRFFDAFEKKEDFGINLNECYMFAARKQLPYTFVKKYPTMADITYTINHFKKWIFSEELKFCFWASPVGILLMHRNIWYEVGGFDERLIYYWFMDVDLGTRIIKKYPIYNIGELFGYDFFHLEHMKSGFRFRHSHRKINPSWSKSFKKPTMNPNGIDWGMSKSYFKLNKLLIPPITNLIEGKETVTMSNFSKVHIFLNILKGTTIRWFYYQIKHVWYLSKKLRKKEYL